MEALVTLSSDFEKQSVGVANMEAVVHAIHPRARVLHLAHGLPPFDAAAAAHTLESLCRFPVGAHVCVVDPGVGSARRALIVQTGRGDFLVGPDNGCLMAAPRVLGGVRKAVAIENRDYMLEPVSPVFHGRDVFAPAAAHLSRGVPLKRFGPRVRVQDCAPAPYPEAVPDGDRLEARVVGVNRFGSVHLNILHRAWDAWGVEAGECVVLRARGKKAVLKAARTFSEAEKGEAVVLKDEYRRVEVAVNQGAFTEKIPLRSGDAVVLEKK